MRPRRQGSPGGAGRRPAPPCYLRSPTRSLRAARTRSSSPPCRRAAATRPADRRPPTAATTPDGRPLARRRRRAVHRRTLPAAAPHDEAGERRGGVPPAAASRAEAELGETIALTGTEIGVRFDVTVTDVKPLDDDLMAVTVELREHGHHGLRPAAGEGRRRHVERRARTRPRIVIRREPGKHRQARNQVLEGMRVGRPARADIVPPRSPTATTARVRMSLRTRTGSSSSSISSRFGDWWNFSHPPSRSVSANLKSLLTSALKLL